MRPTKTHQADSPSRDGSVPGPLLTLSVGRHATAYALACRAPPSRLSDATSCQVRPCASSEAVVAFSFRDRQRKELRHGRGIRASVRSSRFAPRSRGRNAGSPRCHCRLRGHARKPRRIRRRPSRLTRRGALGVPPRIGPAFEVSDEGIVSSNWTRLLDRLVLSIRLVIGGDIRRDVATVGELAERGVA